MSVERYRQFPESKAPGLIGANVVHEPIVELTAGESVTLDVRGCLHFTPYFSLGTHTYQPCDADGTVIPGSSSANFSNATEVTPKAPYYLVTADGANALTVTRS